MIRLELSQAAVLENGGLGAQIGGLIAGPLQKQGGAEALFQQRDAEIDRDPVRYIDMTEAVRRGIGTVLYASPSAALVDVPSPDGPRSQP